MVDNEVKQRGYCTTLDYNNRPVYDFREEGGKRALGGFSLLWHSIWVPNASVTAAG